MKKLRIVRLGLALREREWLLNDGQIQNPGAQKLDSGTIPNRLEGFWICLSFKDRFLSCPNLTTFSSLYGDVRRRALR
jgi:hypothetical protein